MNPFWPTRSSYGQFVCPDWEKLPSAVRETSVSRHIGPPMPWCCDGGKGSRGPLIGSSMMQGYASLSDSYISVGRFSSLAVCGVVLSMYREYFKVNKFI